MTYYQRSRRRGRDWHEARAKRTLSADCHSPSPAPSLSSSSTQAEALISEIRQNSQNGLNQKRLSQEEIDQVLTEIRARSRSHSRPPPPRATPPPLPKEATPQSNSSLPPRPPETPPPRSKSRSRPPPPSTPPPPLRPPRRRGSYNDECEKRQSVTESEINSILIGHRQKRAEQNSAFYNKAPPSPTVLADTESEGGAEESEDASFAESWCENPAYNAPSNKKKIKIQVRKEVPRAEPLPRRKFKVHVKAEVVQPQNRPQQVHGRVHPEHEQHGDHEWQYPGGGSGTSEAAVDEETAKMVENLKERLKTMDADLNRVKEAAMKINQDIQKHNDVKGEVSETESEEDQSQAYNATVRTSHVSRSTSFVNFGDLNGGGLTEAER